MLGSSHTLNETSTCQTELAVCGTIQIFPLDGNWTLDLTETVASVHTKKHTLKISEKSDLCSLISNTGHAQNVLYMTFLPVVHHLKRNKESYNTD